MLGDQFGRWRVKIPALLVLQRQVLTSPNHYFCDRTSLIKSHYKIFEKLFFVSLIAENTYVIEKMLVIDLLFFIFVVLLSLCVGCESSSLYLYVLVKGSLHPFNSANNVCTFTLSCHSQRLYSCLF